MSNPIHDRVPKLHNTAFIRWIAPRDLPQVVKLHATLGGTWTIDQFKTELRSRTMVGLVAECSSDKATIRGYAIYDYVNADTIRVIELGAADHVARSFLLESVFRRAEVSGRKCVEFTEPSY